MLNYRCKFHKVRSVLNKGDAFCIVEVKNNIAKTFSTIIPNKEKILLYLYFPPRYYTTQRYL
ncbi:hypothetical protein H311_01956 [Anncaliia algerae PRA109]|nr:hypothetical protein H311_01956 [Anncaliia algerae PRA109]